VAIVNRRRERKEFTLNPEEVVVLNANEKFDVLIGKRREASSCSNNGKEVSLPGRAESKARLPSRS